MPSFHSKFGGRIVHVAIQADDTAATAAMYRDIFGFRDLITLNKKTLTSVWLSDGHTYLSVVRYHDESTAESRALPRTACIHHLGLETDRPAECAQELLKIGCTLLSNPGEIPIKFLTADKTMLEIAEHGYFRERFLGRQRDEVAA
jgi:hypothetical protein